MYQWRVLHNVSDSMARYIGFTVFKNGGIFDIFQNLYFSCSWVSFSSSDWLNLRDKYWLQMPKMCANISRNTVEGLSSLGYTRRKTDNFQRKGWPGVLANAYGRIDYSLRYVFRLGDYLPTVHAAYIWHYSIINMVHLSAVTIFYLHHITSVSISQAQKKGFCAFVT